MSPRDTLERTSDRLTDSGAAEVVTFSGRVELLRDAEEAYPAWLDAIARAQHEVLFEMYWFASDATGRRFAEALTERARAGCAVYLLYDAVGSLGTDRAMFETMMTAGVQVVEFHPIAPWRRRFDFAQVTLRDHRKVIVVDNVVAFTGGINVCDPAAPLADGGAGWRDDAVRVTGPAVQELRALFFDAWRRAGGAFPRGETIAAPRPRRRRELVQVAKREAGNEPHQVIARFRERVYEQARRVSLAPLEALAERARPTVEELDRASAPDVQVLGHSAWAARRTIRAMYLRHIRGAQRTVLVQNSYFVPDGTVRRALERAARRGVEVRVIVPAESDVPGVKYAGQALYTSLLRAGVHVHEWVGSMMHAKTAVIDGWATVGSYNFDYRSLRYNLEVNIASVHPAFVARLEGTIRDDLAHCREVDLATWLARPWTQRLLEWGYFLVRKIL